MKKLWIDFCSKQSMWFKSKCYHCNELFWYFVVLSTLLKVCVCVCATTFSTDHFVNTVRYRFLNWCVLILDSIHIFVSVKHLLFLLLFFYSPIDSFRTVILGARECSNSTKSHLTRCDMYYKCTVMSSGNVVWVPENCPNGLVYDTKFLNCVIPGEQKRKRKL